MAGLSGNRALVNVGPPLFANGRSLIFMKRFVRLFPPSMNPYQTKGAMQFLNRRVGVRERSPLPVMVSVATVQLTSSTAISGAPVRTLTALPPPGADENA